MDFAVARIWSTSLLVGRWNGEWAATPALACSNSAADTGTGGLSHGHGIPNGRPVKVLTITSPAIWTTSSGIDAGRNQPEVAAA